MQSLRLNLDLIFPRQDCLPGVPTIPRYQEKP